MTDSDSVRTVQSRSNFDDDGARPVPYLQLVSPVVSQLIANFPCIIAFRGDNSNVGTCPETLHPPCVKDVAPRLWRTSGIGREGHSLISRHSVVGKKSAWYPLFMHARIIIEIQKLKEHGQNIR